MWFPARRTPNTPITAPATRFPLLVSAFLTALPAVSSMPAYAQAVPANPVVWSLAPGARAATTTAATVQVRARIASGWHVYALTQQEGGPYPLRISAGDSSITIVHDGIVAPSAERQPTSPFGVPVEWYSGAVNIDVPVRLRASRASRDSVQLLVRYQACSDALCLPPRTVRLATPITRTAGAAR